MPPKSTSLRQTLSVQKTSTRTTIILTREPSAHSNVPDDNAKKLKLALFFKKLQSASKESGDISRSPSSHDRFLLRTEESNGLKKTDRIVFYSPFSNSK
jgi:hypothetical protein